MEVFATMITPFKSNGEADLETAEKYVDFYFENNLTGIFSVCQSSEIFHLSLEERVALNGVVYRRAKDLEKKHGRKFTVVSSGHISDSAEEQVRELSAVSASGTDALILITNRLDINNEGDDVFIANAEALLKQLPTDIKLGLYECPYPYKRLVTPRILKWCVSTGRFYYMKDTCCDINTIKQRCDIIKNSNFMLLNANCQTLLQSMRDGADGYCGIMCNFHPKLYAWLCAEFRNYPEKADFLQSVIGTFGFTEVGTPYPLTAKYHMNLCDIPTELITRNPNARELTDYDKYCTEQMKRATDFLEKNFISI